MTEDAKLISVTVYQDDQRVAQIEMRREYVEVIATQGSLETFYEDSLGFYTCVDGPVLVIWGKTLGQLRILGLTIDVKTLRAESALRQAWEEFKSKSLTRRQVHNAITDSLGSLSN